MVMTFKGKMAAPCVPCVSANMWIFSRYLRYCVKSCLNIQQQNVRYKFTCCTMYLFLLGIGSNSWCALYMGRRTFRVSKGNFSGAYYTWVRIIIGKLRYFFPQTMLWFLFLLFVYNFAFAWKIYIIYTVHTVDAACEGLNPTDSWFHLSWIMQTLRNLSNIASFIFYAHISCFSFFSFLFLFHHWCSFHVTMQVALPCIFLLIFHKSLYCDKKQFGIEYNWLRHISKAAIKLLVHEVWVVINQSLSDKIIMRCKFIDSCRLVFNILNFQSLHRRRRKPIFVHS